MNTVTRIDVSDIETQLALNLVCLINLSYLRNLAALCVIENCKITDAKFEIICQTARG